MTGWDWNFCLHVSEPNHQCWEQAGRLYPLSLVIWLESAEEQDAGGCPSTQFCKLQGIPQTLPSNNKTFLEDKSSSIPLWPHITLPVEFFFSIYPLFLFTVLSLKGNWALILAWGAEVLRSLILSLTFSFTPPCWKEGIVCIYTFLMCFSFLV